MLGFTTSPLGPLTVTGYGTPESATVPPSRPILAPYIDGRTGGMVIGGDGELEPMPVNAQRILLTCLTALKSSTVLRDFGTDLPPHITDSFESECDTELRRALDYMVKDGSVTIDAIRAERAEVTGRVVITVSYTDQQTGISRQVRVNV